MDLGKTFQEKYTNFFKFFGDSPRTLKEINNFIHENNIPISSRLNKINLNMIDSQNLNILFHIIRKSVSDLDCLEKLKLLIEQYHVKYNLFDVSRHRTLPFYTCVKGYLESTKYLIERMNYNIKLKDNREETLFFSAIRSYNVELVKYLDEKYKNWIYFPNIQYNSCIFNIFKNSIKNEEEEKIKNIFRFILNKGFDIDQKNNKQVSFRDLCCSYGIINYLEDVLKEFEAQKVEKDKKIINDTDVNALRNNNKNTNIFEDKLNTELSISQDIYKMNDVKIKKENENIKGKNNKSLKDYNESNNQDVINNKHPKGERSKKKLLNENKPIIDSDNSDISMDNISVCTFNKNQNKRRNNKKDFIGEQINDDYYSFSDISSLDVDNIDNTIKKENDNYLFNNNNDKKLKKKEKCCIFIDKEENIIVNLIGEKIKRSKKLKKAYLNKIIYNNDSSNIKDKYIKRKKKLEKK